MLSEISQTEKDKYHMISFICGIEEQTNQNQTHEYGGQSGESQRGGELKAWKNGVKG